MSDDQKKERDKIRTMVSRVVRQQIGSSPDETVPGTSVSDQAPRSTIDESVREVITEGDLKNVPAGASVIVREDAILTPSAKDLVQELNLEIKFKTRHTRTGLNRLIAIGSDHGGFEMKEKLKRYLDQEGYKWRDFGTVNEDAVDYPDFAHAVARAVADGVCDLGIIVDGAGIGSCMTANKVPGVRAAMCYDEATARNSREHNYANVLTLGGRMIDDSSMKRIVSTWLATPDGEARHGKRVAKIMAVEKQYLR